MKDTWKKIWNHLFIYVCILYIYTIIINAPFRRWIAALNSRVDPVRKDAIQKKGDNGMVKKTISKSSEKRSVSRAYFCGVLDGISTSFCWDPTANPVHIYELLVGAPQSKKNITDPEMAWGLGTPESTGSPSAVLVPGLVAQHWSRVLHTQRPLQNGCWRSTRCRLSDMDVVLVWGGWSYSITCDSISLKNIA